MSKVPFRSFFTFYNSTGTLSIKSSNHGLKTATPLALFNVLRIPLVSIFTFFQVTSQELRQAVYKHEFINMEFFSLFTKILLLISSEIIHSTAMLTCIINFWRRAHILRFLQEMFEVTIDDKYVKKLINRWKKDFAIITFIFLTIATLQFLAKLKFVLGSFAVWFLTAQPNIILTSFLSLTKSLERFFVILLKDFKNELRKTLELPTVDFAAYRRLMEKYQKIYNLNRKFRQIFGLQHTLITCCVAAMTTLQVMNLTRIW